MTANPAATDTVPRASTTRRGTPAALWPLARLEISRLGRHPLLWAGTALCAFFTAMAISELKHGPTGDILGAPVVSLCVGVFSMIAAHHLARSFHRTEELVASAPTGATTRGGALCVAAVVPAVVASTWLIFYYSADTRVWTVPEYLYGTFSRADVAAILIGNTAVAAAGGTLVGIAAGRWWRFRGASAALVVAMVAWTIGIIGVFSNAETVPAGWERWVRLFTPVNYFTNAATEGGASDSMTGSPAWYLGWLVTLCALAAIAALLKGSEGAARGRLVRLGAVALVVSAVTYGLAAAGGNSQVVRTYPDGHSVVLRR